MTQNESCDTCDLKLDCPNESIKQKRLEALKILGRGYGFSAKDIIENLSTMFPCENYIGETQ